MYRCLSVLLFSFLSRNTSSHELLNVRIIQLDSKWSFPLLYHQPYSLLLLPADTNEGLLLHSARRRRKGDFIAQLFIIIYAWRGDRAELSASHKQWHCQRSGVVKTTRNQGVIYEELVDRRKGGELTAIWRRNQKDQRTRCVIAWFQLFYAHIRLHQSNVCLMCLGCLARQCIWWRTTHYWILHISRIHVGLYSQQLLVSCLRITKQMENNGTGVTIQLTYRLIAGRHWNMIVHHVFNYTIYIVDW